MHVVGLSHLFTTEPPAAAQQRLENDQDELQERAQAERERPSWVSTARALPGALTPAQRDLVTEAATGLPVPVGTREARERTCALDARAGEFVSAAELLQRQRERERGLRGGASSSTK